MNIYHAQVTPPVFGLGEVETDVVLLSDHRAAINLLRAALVEIDTLTHCPVIGEVIDKALGRTR